MPSDMEEGKSTESEQSSSDSGSVELPSHLNETGGDEHNSSLVNLGNCSRFDFCFYVLNGACWKFAWFHFGAVTRWLDRRWRICRKTRRSCRASRSVRLMSGDWARWCRLSRRAGRMSSMTAAWSSRGTSSEIFRRRLSSKNPHLLR